VYPELIQFTKITVYDVADKVLSMFDEKLGKYAMDRFRRDGIEILTSHHVQELRRGAPKTVIDAGGVKDDADCYTLDLKEEGEIGVGMCVWSTGLMMNPFVTKALREPIGLPESELDSKAVWHFKTDEKSGALITNDRLRAVVESDKGRKVLDDVFALGDCAMMEDTLYPATAQVASQKANWLAKRLNKGDIETNGFNYKDLGVMAYVGNWNAIMQSSGGDISGRVAWLVWRGAYLVKSVSWRNRVLIPTYWFLNWIFGRDISRF